MRTAASLRWVLGATLCLSALSALALVTEHANATPAASVAASAPTFATTAPAPPTTVAPTTTTTAMPPTTTVAPRTSPPTTRVTPATTSPRPTVAPVAPTAAATATGGGKLESCGWGWDAQRIDDGSYDGVVVSLDAPHRPNSLVTITASPHGPATVPTVRALTTDGNGQASIEVRLSEDKRDWTLTVSALFAGSHCAPQSFTIVY